MARFEMLEQGFGGASAQADILFELGMMYATGRDCDADMVAAHKWFNIAAIKGSTRAARRRCRRDRRRRRPDHRGHGARHIRGRRRLTPP